MSASARTSPRMKSLRRTGSASSSTSQPRRAQLAPSRFLASQTSDSGMCFRMKTTRRAGSRETKKQARQPQSSPNHDTNRGSRKDPTTEARRMPRGAPVCMTAAKRARILAGKVSPMRVCPVAHSPPTPEARDDAEDEEEPEGVGHAAEEGPDGVGQHGPGEHLLASEPVGEAAEDDAAQGRGRQGRPQEEGQLPVAQAEVPLDGDQEEGQEHEVVEIEEPPGPGHAQDDQVAARDAVALVQEPLRWSSHGTPLCCL